MMNNEILSSLRIKEFKLIGKVLLIPGIVDLTDRKDINLEELKCSVKIGKLVNPNNCPKNLIYVDTIILDKVKASKLYFDSKFIQNLLVSNIKGVRDVHFKAYTNEIVGSKVYNSSFSVNVIRLDQVLLDNSKIVLEVDDSLEKKHDMVTVIFMSKLTILSSRILNSKLYIKGNGKIKATELSKSLVVAKTNDETLTLQGSNILDANITGFKYVESVDSCIMGSTIESESLELYSVDDSNLVYNGDILFLDETFIELTISGKCNTVDISCVSHSTFLNTENIMDKFKIKFNIIKFQDINLSYDDFLKSFSLNK